MAEPLGSDGFADRRIAVGIGEETAGLRLDRALQHSLPELAGTRLKQLILSGPVARAGPEAGAPLRDPAQRVHAGQNLIVHLPEARDADPAAQAIPLEIVFEDPHLIVIDKPAGMVVHPAPGNLEGTLVNALLAH